MRRKVRCVVPQSRWRARCHGADGVCMWRFEQVVGHVRSGHDRRRRVTVAEPPAAHRDPQAIDTKAATRSAEAEARSQRGHQGHAVERATRAVHEAADRPESRWRGRFRRQERGRECQRHARQGARSRPRSAPAAASRGSRSTASGTTCPPTRFRRRRVSRCRPASRPAISTPGKILAAIGDPAKLLDNASVSSEKVEGIDSDKVSGDVNIAALQRPPPMSPRRQVEALRRRRRRPRSTRQWHRSRRS